MKIRPSQIVSTDECPYAAHLQYGVGVKSKATSSNLVFGKAMHYSEAKYLEALHGGMAFDMVEAFRFKWQEQVESMEVKYNSTMGPEDLLATGERLCELFPDAWKRAELVPLIDEKGPLIERRLQVVIGAIGDEEIVLSAEPDFIGLNSDGKVVVLDFKTPANPADEEFTLKSDQLTCYQIVAEAYADRFGIYGADLVGYMDLVKKKIPKSSRGTGPVVEPPLLVPARSAKQKYELIQKILWMAEDIKSGRFPKRPRMAYNSPCGMCDYAAFCLHGETEGLIFPEETQEQAA